MKTCSKCHIPQPLSEFYKQGNKRFYHSECKKCFYLRNKDWRKRNPEKTKLQYERAKSGYTARRKKYWDIVINHYGGKCNCPNCPETNRIFLTIDHIDNNGGIARKNRKMGGYQFYYWIIKNNFPTNLQLLCFNCNEARHFRGGINKICPHMLS